ncbi:speckle-type POZ protein-like [Parasteatoda tepidariorum]|uniref:speckle-type POZ protein-like n=1 Tax=Parasteatoda tepidariorum TaxID=114398 RepID=UPI001C71B2F7|nr:speckle-type POZ protein-like [Parasteatoda tepidariorum]
MAERISYFFRWEIENYSSCYYESWNKCPKSPVFTPANFGGSKWYMTLIPPLKTKEPDEDILFCYLHRNDIDAADEEVSIAFIFQLIGESGNIIHTKGCSSFRFKRVFKRKCSDWQAFQCGQIAKDSLTWNKDILTIQCQMYTMQERPSSVARTKIEVDRASFIWQINLPESKSFLMDRIFSLSETSLYEISATDAPNGFIELRVRKLKGESSSTRLLNGKISFLNHEGEKILWQNVQHLFPSNYKNDVWVLPSFIARRTIINDKNNQVNCVALFCEFSAPNGNVLSDIVSINDPSSMKLSNVLTMRGDLVKMFADQEHSDVELKAENMSLPAHKFLLSARSPVFRAMFHHKDMLENESNVVEISDVDSKTLKSFLEFLYTGSVDIIDDESALGLLIIADKYQVLSLIDTCSRFALSALSLENACEILYLSDLLNLKLLRDNAVDFVVKHFNEISKSCDWSEYIEKNPSLVFEILSHLMKDLGIVP